MQQEISLKPFWQDQMEGTSVTAEEFVCFVTIRPLAFYLAICSFRHSQIVSQNFLML
jgi:hypothetical protein